jgi:hypothetical protein
MTRICSWCGKHLGTTDDDSDDITHGICPTCRRLVEAHAGAQTDADRECLGLLAQLRKALGAHPHTTVGWLRMVWQQCIQAEADGRTYFGGPLVMLWWVVQQCRSGRWAHPQRVNTYLGTR